MNWTSLIFSGYLRGSVMKMLLAPLISAGFLSASVIFFGNLAANVGGGV